MASRLKAVIIGDLFNAGVIATGQSSASDGRNAPHSQIGTRGNFCLIVRSRKMRNAVRLAFSAAGRHSGRAMSTSLLEASGAALPLTCESGEALAPVTCEGGIHNGFFLASCDDVAASRVAGLLPHDVARLSAAAGQASFAADQGKAKASLGTVVVVKSEGSPGSDDGGAAAARTALANAVRQARTSSAALSKTFGEPLKRTASVAYSPAAAAAVGGSAKAAFLATQAVLLGDYQFNAHITDTSSAASDLSDVGVLVPADGAELEEAQASSRRAAALAAGCALARRTAGEGADVATPAELEKLAHAVAEEASRIPGLTAAVHVERGEERLVQLGMRLFAAVGQAAGRARPDTHAPRLVAITMRRDAAADSSVEEDGSAVVCLGKAVCFDSGGLNLKPTGSIEEMHMDKGGGAAVLGAALATARAGGPPADGLTYVFAVAACENAIDAHSYKPHAIIKSMQGRTVEVGNTDAEGRLVLADSMTYLQREHKTKVMVDVATLTGACVIALGDSAAGLFSNNDELATAITGAGEEVGETFWRLPVLPAHRAALKSTRADLRSTGKGRGGGASTAAAFLEKFVEEGVHWAHLDIAGPGMTTEAAGIHCAGATGYASQTLAQWVLSGKASEASRA